MFSLFSGFLLNFFYFFHGLLQGRRKEISQEMNNEHKRNDEDWDLDLNLQVSAQSQNYGSDDECERDINVDCETFGLTQKDLILMNPS